MAAEKENAVLLELEKRYNIQEIYKRLIPKYVIRSEDYECPDTDNDDILNGRIQLPNTGDAYSNMQFTNTKFVKSIIYYVNETIFSTIENEKKNDVIPIDYFMSTILHPFSAINFLIKYWEPDSSDSKVEKIPGKETSKGPNVNSLDTKTNNSNRCVLKYTSYRFKPQIISDFIRLQFWYPHKNSYGLIQEGYVAIENSKDEKKYSIWFGGSHNEIQPIDEKNILVTVSSNKILKISENVFNDPEKIVIFTNPPCKDFKIAKDKLDDIEKKILEIDSSAEISVWPLKLDFTDAQKQIILNNGIREKNRFLKVLEFLDGKINEYPV